MKKIDFENHFYLRELIDYLGTRSELPKFNKETNSVQLREGLAAPYGKSWNYGGSMLDDICDFSEERLKRLDEAGIDVAILSSSPGIEELPEKEAIYFAKKSNDVVAALTKKYPGRFLGSATLPTKYVDASIKELERCIKELGFVFWNTHSNYRDEHLYDEKYLPLLAKAEELNCPFYIHPSFSDDPDLKGYGFNYPGAGLGFGQDTMRTSLRLILNGIFDMFPRLRMILGHLGEYYPFVLDRMDNRFAVVKEPEYNKLKHSIKYYFENRNVMLTTSGNMSPDALRCTLNVIGADGILFATDYPYEPYHDIIDFLNLQDLTDEEREKLYYKNAEKYIFAKH